MSVDANRLLLAERAEPRAVAAMRDAVAEYAVSLGAGSDVASAVKLAASEALTNAVLHAYADEPEPGAMTLESWGADGSLFVVVCDDGRGMAPRLDSPGLGLGLPLVASMADDFRVEDRPDRPGTKVAMKFSLDGSGLT